jgi:hypothetical protein
MRMSPHISRYIDREYQRQLRAKATKRLAARLGLVTGAELTLVAVASFLASMPSTVAAIVFALGILWGAWGAYHLCTRH